MDTSIDVSSAVEKWIDPLTNLPKITRVNIENVEQRTVAAAELYKARFYTSIKQASDAFKVPYKRLWNRIQGAHPRKQNGGNRTIFSEAEEREILVWAHRRVTQGHHVRLRTLNHHANAILAAKGETTRASLSWARRFMRRHKNEFHIRKSTSRDAKRKAMQDRGAVESFFRSWRRFLIENKGQTEEYMEFRRNWLHGGLS